MSTFSIFESNNVDLELNKEKIHENRFLDMNCLALLTPHKCPKICNQECLLS